MAIGLIFALMLCGKSNKDRNSLSAPASISRSSQSSLQTIKDNVALDAVAQYNIAARQGDPMQKCVQAGFVAAAYLQAQDQPAYDQWKAIERSDCQIAGLSQ